MSIRVETFVLFVLGIMPVFMFVSFWAGAFYGSKVVIRSLDDMSKDSANEP